MSTAPTIVVQNMPPEYLEKFNASRAYICNITDTEYNLTRTYGNYHIPAKAQGEKHTVTEISPRKGTMDMGDRRTFDFPITPSEVANCLCREVNGDAGLNSFLGVFVIAGPEPTAAELKKGNERLLKFYQWGVAEGDKIWQQSRMVMLIPDWIKRAADYLGINRDWKTDVQPNLECEGCGAHYKFGVALCASCGLVLNVEKARKLYPERFAAAPAEVDPASVLDAVAPRGIKKS